MTKPLNGVRVIDMSHVIAGPMASYYLAQLGAEVIKIEPPVGEVMRNNRLASEDAASDTPSGFVTLNAGKKSLAVDIRKPAGAQLLRRLAASADVFIENFRPGKVARYGLGYDDIRAIRPDIVYCSISGYGQQGPWSQRGAYDHVVQALTGMMMMSGDAEDSPPIKVGFPVIDLAVGMLGALSITAALHRRAAGATGERVGSYIDASMLQGSLMLMYPLACNYLTHGLEAPRVGNRGYSGSPSADTYRCRDGWISVAANTPAQFRKLAAALGMEQVCGDADLLDLDAFNATQGGFVVARDLPALRALFQSAFAARGASEMETQLNGIGIPSARVRRIGEFLQEGCEIGAVSTATIQQPDGTVSTTPGLGFLLDGQARGGDGAPRLGADSRGILEALGIAGSEIEALRQAGVLATVDRA